MKMNWIYVWPLALGLLFLNTACEKDDDSEGNLVLNISGLEDLGSDYAYEGWIIVDGQPVTTGVFTVDSEGDLNENEFEVDAAQLENATTFVLTIEPSPDNDPAPSDVHILAGDFMGNSQKVGFAFTSTEYQVALVQWIVKRILIGFMIRAHMYAGS